MPRTARPGVYTRPSSQRRPLRPSQEGVAPSYSRVMIGSFAEEEPHRVRLCMQVVDEYNRPQSGRALIHISYFNDDGPPTYWADPGVYQSLIADGEADVCGAIYTDDDGFVSLSLLYEGIDTSTPVRIEAHVDGSPHIESSRSITVSGDRVYVDVNDSNAIDDPSSGSKTQPYASISYAKSQLALTANRPLAAQTVICVVSDATYAAMSSIVYGGNIVGLSGNVNIVIGGDLFQYTLYQFRRGLLRNLTITAGPASETEVLMIYRYTGSYLADVRITGNQDYGIRVDSLSQGPLRAVGCRIELDGTYLCLFSSATAMKTLMHTTIVGASTGAHVAGASVESVGFRVYDCAITGTPNRFLDGRIDLFYEGNRNRFVGPIGAGGFSRFFGTVANTFDEHKTLVAPNDDESTWAAA